MPWVLTRFHFGVLPLKCRRVQLGVFAPIAPLPEENFEEIEPPQTSLGFVEWDTSTSSSARVPADKRVNLPLATEQNGIETKSGETGELVKSDDAKINTKSKTPCILLGFRVVCCGSRVSS